MGSAEAWEASKGHTGPAGHLCIHPSRDGGAQLSGLHGGRDAPSWEAGVGQQGPRSRRAGPEALGGDASRPGGPWQRHAVAESSQGPGATRALPGPHGRGCQSRRSLQSCQACCLGAGVVLPGPCCGPGGSPWTPRTAGQASDSAQTPQAPWAQPLPGLGAQCRAGFPGGGAPVSSLPPLEEAASGTSPAFARWSRAPQL